MNQNQPSKERYNLDDDTSSFSPEIEEESNNEEEQESAPNNEPTQKAQINPEQNSSQLMDKLISIQKQMDTNQKKLTKNSSSNYKENNNTDNKIPKNKNKKVKDILNLDESDSDSEEDLSNNNSNNNNLNSPKEKEPKNITKKNNMQQVQSFQPAGQKKEKGCELFIGNLNISTEKEELNNLFSPFGEITDIRIHKNEENKKCYAFVRFSSRESATSALKLDSSLLNNRHIKVTKSNENATIFIGNIRKTWTKEELETKIRRIFHNISKIEFFTDPGNPNKNRGFCFGIFNTRNEAIKALNYVNKKGGINIDGISITCDWADVVDDDDNSQSNQIFISNIKKEVNEADLKKYFDKLEKVVSVIMSKNHLNSKRKDLAFITFESHESAISAIKKFEEEKKNPDKEKSLKKIFFLSDKESVNSIQVSLAFSQEAMQNKKKIKDNRKKVPTNQTSKGHNTNINNNNSNDNNKNNNNNNNSNNNNSNKNSGKTFMGNISMNAQNEYKNYSSGLRSKNYQRHDHGRSHNYLGGNKNVQDLFSSLNNNNNNNNNKNMYRNNSMNYPGNKGNNNLYNQLNQLFASSLDNNINKSTNVYMNNNNNVNNVNNNLNQNQLSALTNLINMCQQNPNFLQQMTSNITNLYNGNDLLNINNDKKFLNRKRNTNNYLENNLDNDNNLSNNNSNEIQNNTYLNISQTNQTQNQNFIPQFPYIQNIPPLSPINTSNIQNVPNIQNLQNIIPTIQNNIQNNPNFN